MMLCFITAQAQTLGVAVLTHGDAKTMFYGNTALQQAVEAATDGDVISLSPGTFIGVDNFNKSDITIIGSGMDEGASQTILTSLRLNAESMPDRHIRFILRNVYIANNLSIHYAGNYDLKIEKCKTKDAFYCPISSEAGNSANVEMSNCISGFHSFANNVFTNSSLKANNCVLKIYTGFDGAGERIMTNCILIGNFSGQNTASISNCIVYNNGVSGMDRLPEGVQATNCKAITSDSGFFCTQTLTNETFGTDFDPFAEGSFFELKPELASSWVDENGEQIGIYGGPEPFSAIPNAPRFTKFNVPTKTDADGKLPVEIEIAMPAK